jgi:hypothetical protein
MNKIRVESFAKTPYFLKSPRSLTSSRGPDLDDFLKQEISTYSDK